MKTLAGLTEGFEDLLKSRGHSKATPAFEHDVTLCRESSDPLWMALIRTDQIDASLF
jgi:hypothetical protein